MPVAVAPSTASTVDGAANTAAAPPVIQASQFRPKPVSLNRAFAVEVAPKPRVAPPAKSKHDGAQISSAAAPMTKKAAAASGKTTSDGVAKSPLAAPIPKKIVVCLGSSEAAASSLALPSSGSLSNCLPSQNVPPQSAKQRRKKSSKRRESRRAYQQRRNRRQRDDARRYREFEARISHLEDKKDRDIVIVLQDHLKTQVLSQSAAATVSASGSVLVDASASTIGAHRLETGISRFITTSAAKPDTSTGLVVDDVSGNAIVASPSPGFDVERLKTGNSSFVTSTISEVGHQQQSASGVERLKTGINQFVTSATGVQKRLGDVNDISVTAEGLRSDDAEHRLKASSLVTTRVSSKQTSCPVSDSGGHTDAMDVDPNTTEDGQIVESNVSSWDSVLRKNAQQVGSSNWDNPFLPRQNPPSDKKKESTNAWIEQYKKDLEDSKCTYENNQATVLSGYFKSEINGYFTRMLKHSQLECTGMKKIEYEYRDILNLRKYMNYRKYTQACDNEATFINRRRYYLSQPPLIETKKYDNQDEHFLSALVNCHLFNDKYMNIYYCPCNRVHKEWLDKFCFFRRDITECKKPLDFNSAEALYEHCGTKGLHCRWHQLCYKFMQKVFFRQEDDFITTEPFNW